MPSRTHVTRRATRFRWPEPIIGGCTTSLICALAALLVSCTPAPSPEAAEDNATVGDASDPAPPVANDSTILPPPPWAGDALQRDQVAAVFVSSWTAAENRTGCPLIAPAGPLPAGARPRAATFSGGWGVAWDVRGTRSAFGIAGTGAQVSSDTYDRWPNRIEWSDGSTVGYGPEGGTGPNQLAYLEIPGSTCLYNVWSRIGTDHLEQLLKELRFVQTG